MSRSICSPENQQLAPENGISSSNQHGATLLWQFQVWSPGWSLITRKNKLTWLCRCFIGYGCLTLKVYKAQIRSVFCKKDRITWVFFRISRFMTSHINGNHPVFPYYLMVKKADFLDRLEFIGLLVKVEGFFSMQSHMQRMWTHSFETHAESGQME